MHKFKKVWSQGMIKKVLEPTLFKQLKPCSNHVIYVLFEHVFYLQILKTGRTLLKWCQNNNARLPRNKHFILIFVDINEKLYFSRIDVKQNKKHNGLS